MVLPLVFAFFIFEKKKRKGITLPQQQTVQQKAIGENVYYAFRFCRSFHISASEKLSIRITFFLRHFYKPRHIHSEQEK